MLAYWLIETQLRSPANRSERVRAAKHAQHKYPMPRAHTGETPKPQAKAYDDEQIALEIAADLEEGGHVSRNPLSKGGRGSSFHWMGAGPRTQPTVGQWGAPRPGSARGQGQIVVANPLAAASPSK